MESKVRSENYITIQGWAVSELGLKGNDLLVYSIIYGFSQDDNYFCGSLKYLEDWTNSSRQGILKNINYLLDRGLIEKLDIPGSKTNCYKAKRVNSVTESVNSVTTDVNSVNTGGELSSHNNIDNTKDNNKEKDVYAKSCTKKIIDYLNETCHTNFKSNTTNTIKIIKARLNEGFSLQDFFKVIEYKYQTWGVTPFKFSSGKSSEYYLRPATLFGEKFETYLYEANSFIAEVNRLKEHEKETKKEKIDFDNIKIYKEY